MGHAVVARMISPILKPKVFVYLNYMSTGLTRNIFKPLLSTRSISIINAAGPIFNMFFCLGKIAIINKCNAYIPKLLVSLFKICTFFEIFLEVSNGIISAYKKDDRDFGVIAKNETFHLILATAALASQTVLAMFLLLPSQETV